MAKQNLSTEEIKKEALNIIDGEYKNWDSAVCYVTDKVGFKMRELIKVCRKNYWGVFDNPKDSVTGLDKIFIGLPMSVVEDVVKNIDIDTKDINFMAKHPSAVGITEITRGVVKDELDKMYFGEILDETERQLCIDGTVVWKTWSEGRGKLRRETVDLLNIYIDPTAKSIQEAYRFTERCLLTPEQITYMTGWKDIEDVKGSTGLNPNDSSPTSVMAQNTTGSFVDVWEMWGKIPEGLITGKVKDMNKEVDGHIVASGLQTGDRRIHLIEKNTNKDQDGNIIKPYEELRAAKITGRWYGLGFVERILALTEYLNTVVNMRINRARVSQLGLFKIRKGAGITPSMLAKLPSNGAISVQQMDDIEQFNIQGPDATSYQDEEVIRGWATRVTQAFPVTSGEGMPASTTATSASIQNTNGRSSFQMVKEAIDSFIQRWMNRHALPIIAKSVDVDDIIRITDDNEKFGDIVEKISAYYANEVLEEMKKVGIYPEPAAVEQAIQDAKEQLAGRKNLFLSLVEELMTNMLETKVYMTTESGDTTVMQQNLLTLLQVAPEYREDTVSEIYNLMGLRKPRINKDMREAQLLDMGVASPTGIPNESPQQIQTRAKTLVR